VSGGGFALNYAWQFAAAGAAYKAKLLCSGVFVAKRNPQAVLTQDFDVEGLEPLRYVSSEIDKENRSVTAGVFGLVHRSAVFRPGLGCTLVFNGIPHLPEHGASDNSHKLLFNTEERSVLSKSGQPAASTAELAHWSTPEIEKAFNLSRLSEVVDWAFSEPDTKRPRRTRAIVILYHGKIAAEKYAAGFDKNTPLLGWSMTKSVVNALVGILVKEGRLDINHPAPVAEWQAPDDPRRQITVNDLMHMVSGLRFVENYKDTLSDVTRMLFDVGDAAAFAVDKTLQAPPGRLWSYSSGSPEIVCSIIKNSINGKTYLDFPRQALFDPLGMRSAVMEPDAAGTLLGSSFMYATPRDWARFGQLYLQDGVWNGKRILPQGWVKFTTTPVPISPQGQYGSYFWLKLPVEFRSAHEEYVLPQDTYHAAGYDGQLITIIPSQNLVIVRMGMTRYPVIWPQDQFVTMLLDAMKR